MMRLAARGALVGAACAAVYRLGWTRGESRGRAREFVRAIDRLHAPR